MRHFIKYNSFLIISLLCILSCHISYASVQIQSLIQKYGQPTLTNHLANGNTVYVFTVQSLKSYKPPRTSNPTVIVAPGGRAIGASIPPPYDQPSYTSIQCSLIYEIDRQGAIIYQERQGSGC